MVPVAAGNRPTGRAAGRNLSGRRGFPVEKGVLSLWFRGRNAYMPQA